MPPEVQAALITGVFGLILLVTGALLRRHSQSSARLRRVLDQRESLENYAFTLRRQVFAGGRKPHRWPAELQYLARDDPDQLGDDE